MLGTAFLLLFGNALLTLRLGSGGQSSFPRPLPPEEERKYLEEWIDKGNIEARNILIEHNLRLVAHIIKKGYPSRKLFLADNGRNEV